MRDKKFLTSEEVMEVYGFSKKYLDHICWKKKINYYQPSGRKRFFKPEDVDAFMEG